MRSAHTERKVLAGSGHSSHSRNLANSAGTNTNFFKQPLEEAAPVVATNPGSLASNTGGLIKNETYLFGFNN